MPLWAMAIDLEKCTACGTCAAVCKMENNVAFEDPEEAKKGRAITWLRLMNTVEGDYPEVKSKHVPMLCFQCNIPPCVRVCPVHATYRADDGIVGQIYPRCIGCRYCMAACPYTAKYFNWYAPKWEDTMPESRNPEVSLRPKGVVEKCTFCYHRLQRGREQARAEGRPFTEQDYQPACVQACPADAMVFGDLEDPRSPVKRLSKNSRATRFREDLGTEPKVFYLVKGEEHV